jgi:iron-sulfur cluster assembly protein
VEPGRASAWRSFDILIDISDEAARVIKSRLPANPSVRVRIVLKKGGCAGNTLCLALGEPESSDTELDYLGIGFAISARALPFCDNLSIHVRNGLGSEIVVVNKDAVCTCRCGKSFKI